MHRINSGIVVLVLSAFVLSYYLFNSIQTNTGTLKIGGAFALTGECSIYGQGELKSSLLAVQEINKNGGVRGTPIELVVVDTRCNLKDSITAISKLIHSDKVSAIIGLTWGDSFQAAYLESSKFGIPAISPSTAIEALLYNKQDITHVFSTWYSVLGEMERLTNYLTENDYHDIAIINDNDPYGLMLANSFKDEVLKRRELELIHSDQVSIGQKDFKTSILKMKSKNIDSVALFFQAPSTKAIFMKQAQELGFKAKFISDSSMEDKSLLKEFGRYMEGVVYSYPKYSTKREAFEEKYKSLYGTDSVGASDTNAYDSVYIIKKALEISLSKDISLTEAISKVDIQGITFDRLIFNAHNHQIDGANHILKSVKNGAFIQI